MSNIIFGTDSQVDQQHGTDHHDKAAKRGVEVNDAEQDAGARHCVQPVQPITVQLILVQHCPALRVHLDVGVGRLVLW